MKSSSKFRDYLEAMQLSLLLTMTILALLFISWIIVVGVLLPRLGVPLPVGMYFIAWPVVMPIFLAVPILVSTFFFVLLFGPPYWDLRSNRKFYLLGLAPIFLAALAAMILLCPLETGGNLWRGIFS